ncbi:hypothetical protein NCS55_01392300 [Fusarium keratoplasticum]|nr:hypothetical protein NCS55_01392300 [Fusarium keratoplasticum]
MCLCSTVRHLAAEFDPDEAMGLVSDLNKHLAAVRAILSKSKPLAREVRYQVVPNNHRTMKILSVQSVDVGGVDQLYNRFKDHVQDFWGCSENNLHQELRRRLACVTIFLRSKLDSEAWVSAGVSGFVQGQKPSELRYAGNKYIKIARKLGGIGSILWLPLEVPSSTWERYLNIDDEEVFDHLRSIGSNIPNYDSFVQRLIASQLDDSSIQLSPYNLALSYDDCFPISDQVVLILCAFGGSAVPVELLKSVRVPHRHWTDDGEIDSTDAVDFDLPRGLVNVLSDDKCLDQASQRPEIVQQMLEDGKTLTWSIRPESMASITSRLSPQTQEDLATTALKLICFACPLVYEGKVNWPPHMKKAIWALLDNATNQKRVPMSLKTHVIDALMFFTERDFFAIRRVAIERAKSMLRKSMSYYYHASIALFDSIMLRLDGNLERSDARIVDFLAEDHDTGTRCDNALQGRLHISHLENKIHRYDNDVASFMYKWEGIHPLSTFEIEVTRRLQGTAARYFHSIGDFQTAKASLEQHLWLNSTKPIRLNTRLLIVTRLGEIHCELGEFEKTLEVLQPELAGLTEKKGRPFRRLSMAMIEAYLGLCMLDTAESIIKQLADVEPPELDDINDQMLHMRRLILVSRTAHEQLRFDEALRLWKFTLQRMESLVTFKTRHGWVLAVIYLSMAHAQLCLGDGEGARQSWDVAVQISMNERYEYAIPILATSWLQKIVGAIHQERGWPFRVMLPGGKPDMTWQ